MMIFSYASNAVLSKARAMYGKRMKEKNYIELMSCGSVPEVAAYLKHKTTYSDVLSSIDESNAHRGDLEMLLKKELYCDFEALGRYDLSVGERFFSYIIARAEINQFMHSLILLTAGKPGEYIYGIPKFFNRYTKIDLDSLRHIKSYDDFLRVIKNSQYYDILIDFRPPSGARPDLTGIEAALYTYLYDLVFGIINKYVKGSPQKELTELFNSYIDLTNFIRITRMKKFYNLSGEYIMSKLLPFGNVSKQQLKNLVYSKNSKQMMIDMKNTRIGKKWFSKGLDIVDKVPKYMRFVKCTHNIRFSISPPVVLMSYIFLKEIEILNITNIIEGIRYKLPSSEISKMMIW